MKRLRTSIRLKLTAAILLPLIGAVLLCWAVGTSLMTGRVVELAQQTVESSLNSATGIVQSEIEHLTDSLELTSQSPVVAAALSGRIDPDTVAALQTIVANGRLSFLTITDRYGNVLYRVSNPGSTGRIDHADPLLQDALNGRAAGSLERLSPAIAGQENPLLPDLMRVAIKPTPHSRSYTVANEVRGLFLTAAAPIRDSDNRVIGAVWGGQLLNNDSRLPDRIAQVLFQSNDKAVARSGYATLFLDAVRIATTVRDAEGDRAIGSLISDDVRKNVSNGQRWVGRAFVVNSWHLAAYEPLRDRKGQVVGSLYVGVDEEPFIAFRSRLNLIYGAILAAVGLVGAAVAAGLGISLSRPIRALELGVRRIAAGESGPDLAISGRDEIAALGKEFNTMKSRLSAREEEILKLNRTLEEKVEERSAELAEKNVALLSAQKELLRSERLASIGLLASGVAHEINNPLAVIRGNAELIELAHPDSDEAETIIRQSARIERIVRNLLDFSRGGEMHKTAFQPSALLDAILVDVGHRIPMGGYRIECRHHTPAAAICGDEEQLRQVFTNLILNGLQVMGDGGLLNVESRIAENGDCTVVITDSGPGIADEAREKLFTPFYSTRRGGTGLGLAISYTIVRDHGGSIDVENIPGRGAAFTVTLPHLSGC